MKPAALALIALALTACATRKPDTPEVLELANRPLVCKGAEQCGLYWRRAQFWVANFTGYKVQVSNESTVSTFNPPNYSRSWGAHVTREPLAADSDRIWIRVTCGPLPLCTESESLVTAHFKRYVTEGSTQAASATP